MKHIICAIVENRPGVLALVSGLFSARGFNIDSLAVGETEDPELSRMTIVAEGDEFVLDQITKQLRKLIPVVKVQDISSRDHVERDLMLIKVAAPADKRGEVLDVIQVFQGKVVDISQEDLIVEVSGPEGKVEAFIRLMRPYGIKEVARTGRIALLRTPK